MPRSSWAALRPSLVLLLAVAGRAHDIPQITAADLRADVELLASDAAAGRATGSAEAVTCAHELAKKEELVYVQAKSEPLKLSRNHLGLKLLQYIRDEAHRFAQHYHHILRRKSQLEEDVKQGRRPPRPRRAKPLPPRDRDVTKAPGAAAPHSTHLTLPILQPVEPLPAPTPDEVIDPEDAR